MSDTPTYTEDDLKIVAAEVHHALTTDADRTRVRELMEDEEIDSLTPPAEADGADGVTWSDLDPEEDGNAPVLDKAVERVHALVTEAADLSEWAVDLGEDKLTPCGATLSINFGDTTGVKIMFAINESVIPADQHNRVIARLAAALVAVEL